MLDVTGIGRTSSPENMSLPCEGIMRGEILQDMCSAPFGTVNLEYFSWGLGEGSFTQGGSDSPEAEDIGVHFGLSSAIVFVIPPVPGNIQV